MTRILVVEDSPTQLERVRLILEEDGLEVETARDGQEGREKLEASRFDLIVSDIVMPRLSGYELCRWAKSDANTKYVPVILLTSLNDPMDIIQALEAGADNFISKPYLPDDLLTRIREILENRRLRPEGISVNVDMLFMGRRFTIGSGKEQILGLLLSAFEDMVRTNRELRAIQAELSEAKEKLEGRVQVSEEMYGTLMKEASDSILITDGEGVILEANLRTAAMAGRPISEIVGRPAADFVPAAQRGGIQSLLDTLAAERSVQRADFVVERPDGTTVEVEASVSMVEVRDRKVVFALLRDVTERRKAADLLRESEKRYRNIVETATEGICSLDAEVRITFANGAFARMLGFTPEEMLGTSVDEYAFPEELAEVRGHMDARRRGVAERYERRLRRKDGKECWCFVSGAPILDSDGRFAGSFGMFTDITEHKQLETRFLQAQKMEAVGRLAGGVAHDFNNLLTVIFGYSDILLRGLEPGPLHEATQEVRRAAERAAGLTRQLLAFSRKQTLVPEVLELGDVVSGLSTLVERLIGEEIVVSVVVSPDLGRVKADRGQLEQVVMNLAVNARDAMPYGGHLTFELQNVELDDEYTATHAEVEPGPYVLLAISDTGTGMDAEIQKRIFEPFFTTKEAGKGTGLGLSTVHGIVLQSGGAISVYSEPGQGTTFKVYLPRFEGDAAIPRADSEGNPKLAAESETVLVVEDDAAIRDLTNLILREAGYTVLVAESPVAAEQVAGSHAGPIHLLLTDVVMPGMRGPELAERLIRVRPDLRVLYMSGYTDDAIGHHGFFEAGTDFLQKPFTPHRMTKKIREVLGRSKR